MTTTTITRFAPSPTGLLHIGHAHAALFAARKGGIFHLRIEDIDQTRSDAAYEQGIFDDLAWLGLDWPRPVMRQSERFDAYRTALATLESMGLLYPCFCTRKDIAAEVARMVSAPHGPEGALYPGTCKTLSQDERAAKTASGAPYALRLDTAKAVAQAGTLEWYDEGRGIQRARPDMLGDVVLARKDMPASYHLCVCVDDAAQGITLVTRGEDLFHATHMHRLIQHLLGLPVPRWHHHDLIADEAGKRLAKRNDALSLKSLRDQGLTAQAVIALVENSPRCLSAD